MIYRAWLRRDDTLLSLIFFPEVGIKVEFAEVEGAGGERKENTTRREDTVSSYFVSITRSIIFLASR